MVAALVGDALTRSCSMGHAVSPLFCFAFLPPFWHFERCDLRGTMGACACEMPGCAWIVKKCTT